MPHQRPIDLNQFPDSPHAAELRAGVSRLRFAAGIEAHFRRQHLERAQIRARVWGVMGVLFAIPLAFSQLFSGQALSVGTAISFSVLISMSLVMGWLTFSRHYQSHYLAIAGVLTPISCLLTTLNTVQSAAQGHHEALILLALQIFGIFQFSGLLYRAALTSCIALLAGFLAGSFISDLPVSETFRYAAPLCLGIALGAIAFHGIEGLARRQFLEGELLTQLLESDPLTGLKNRRCFDESLERTWLQAQRDRRSLAVLMMDVDNFKGFNDLYGHQAGDEALRRVSAVLREAARRPLDMVARYGGEEFALIMHDVTNEHAAEIAEWLRVTVQQLAIPNHDAVVTLSIGVAVAEAAPGRTARGVVQLADEALYAAKVEGRNRVVVRGIDAYRSRDTGVFVAPGISAG
jgi:diguanylate cyclase (GGDEF)-like protein